MKVGLSRSYAHLEPNNVGFESSNTNHHRTLASACLHSFHLFADKPISKYTTNMACILIGESTGLTNFWSWSIEFLYIYSLKLVEQCPQIAEKTLSWLTSLVITLVMELAGHPWPHYLALFWVQNVHSLVPVIYWMRCLVISYDLEERLTKSCTI